jgi:hypothetical protein
MVEILHRHAEREHGLQRRAVGGERDVEHRRRIPGSRVDALEQTDVALGAGDEHRFQRLLEPELVQRAQAVGVAVENVVVGHRRQPRGGRLERTMLGQTETGAGSASSAAPASVPAAML